MSSSSSKVEESAAEGVTELPTYYISHGGGPCFFMKPEDLGPFSDVGPKSALAKGLATFAQGVRPKAILVISAHWEGSEVIVSGGTDKKLYYDYYGFPDYTYQLKWPAQGSPHVTARVQELLREADIPHKTDNERGFDHGVFIPLKLAFPRASVPTVAMSLRSDMDPAFHLKLGAALRPLRREGVLIVGSGFSYHGMFAPAPRAKKMAGCAAFDKWLHTTMAQSSPDREASLKAWEHAPGARLSHPREEHLIPLHVAAGAAVGEDAERIYNHKHFKGFETSMFRFGAVPPPTTTSSSTPSSSSSAATPSSVATPAAATE